MGHANALFCSTREDTLISRVSPTAKQREFLQSSWNNLAEHLRRELKAKHGYPISTWLQGSYKYGTLIKPLGATEGYDVDLGVYFEWSKKAEDVTPTAEQLRDWVQQEIKLYAATCPEVRSIKEPPLERCSRAHYARQFHIDTPTYHLNTDSDERNLACMTLGWEASDPKAFYKWFRDVVPTDQRDQLRRLVRYLKAWAALSFTDAPESRPTSIFLTVLVTDAFQEIKALNQFANIDDDDATIEVVRRIRRRLAQDKHVQNPASSADENLNRMSTEAWEGFFPRLETLLDVCERASEATDETRAALTWSEAFSFLMPLPEADAIEVVDDEERALMVLPEVQIRVTSRKNKEQISNYMNEVSGVARDCDLHFRIINPHIIPQNATVEWTVRNKGADADDFSDLGHRNIGFRLLEVEEHTAYLGRHYMDCIVRLNGQIYSVRRIPVQVRDVQHIGRNPPRPAWTTLRTRRGRR